MYTQCPDCSTSFRVTAEVLKQAAGKVRCGGCGNAFNALEYLSETKPAARAAPDAEASLPELKPDPPEGGLPETISAEQSAALLKTLDELAGSDIRIEDTGVEWRVLEDDEIGEAASDAIAEDVLVDDQPEIDEILEDSPTPVDQFLTDTPPEVDSPEIFEEPAGEPVRTPVEELRFDDNTPLPDDFDLDNEPSYTPPPEPEPEPEPAPEPQADLELSEPDEWTDILDEFEGLAEDLAEPEDVVEELDAVAEELPLEDLAEEPGEEPGEEPVAEDGPLDMDSQFAIQAEAMGIDLSGSYDTLEVEEDEPPLASTEDLDALLAAGTEEERDIEELLQEELLDETDEESEQLELIDDEAPDEHFVPPMTEEEQTINMQIDADLMAIAVEDKDGFASTMVLDEIDIEGKDDKKKDKKSSKKDKKRKKKEKAKEKEEEQAEDPLKETGGGFETIIMEGASVLSEGHEEKQEADKAAAAAALADAAARREAEKAAGKRDINYSMVAGLVALVLVLVGQGVHQARNSLATIPAFNDLVGPMYRALGKPLSPAWDITGWRFEATRGSTDETDTNLTIYSRVGNQSEKPLPYPIIAVSLSDRFEEPLGSVTLDPAEYLANDLDPRRLVEPGNTFEAVITVKTPPENTTSFRLRPCYRSSDGQLRCKEDGFRQ